MATSISHLPLFRTLLAAGMLLLSARAAERPSKIAPAPPPPVPATVKAKRGEVTEIPLRIFGTRGQTLTFLIRTAPGAGKLSAPKNVTDESAVVRYTPPTDRAMVRDSFTYAVRSSEGVSAGAEVKIEIVDVPAELIAPGELNNTKVLAGETETLRLELTNRGGGVCEGEVTVGAPWRVEPAHYRIAANERAIIEVTFAPEVPGEFRGEVHYGSQPDRLTTLSGTAVAALAIRPPALDLKLESLTRARMGAFEITNNTKAEQAVAIRSSERLSLEHRLTLAPGRSAAVTLQTRPDDTEPLAEVIRFEAHGVTAVLPVRAAAVPPLPAATPAPASSTPAPKAPADATPLQSPSSPAPVHDKPRVETPEAEPEPHRFDPMSVTKIVAITSTAITLEWPASASPAACHAEALDLSLGDKGLVKTWRRVSNVQITAAEDNRTRAVFTQLQPAHPYTFRIVAPIGDGGSDEPVAFISCITPRPPPRPPWVTWPRVIGIALIVLLALTLKSRLRSIQTGL